MSTGEDAEGNPVKNVIAAMPKLLTDPTVEYFLVTPYTKSCRKMDKIRLLMLYIISQEGIKDGERKRLMDLAKVTQEEQSYISNLRYLGVTLLKVLSFVSS
jgi:syntaxin-binding protein 1